MGSDVAFSIAAGLLVCVPREGNRCYAFTYNVLGILIFLPFLVLFLLCVAGFGWGRCGG